LSFANRPLSRIYEFDYETGEPSRIIKLEKDGPNAVNLFFNIGIFFHSKDSIFVDSGGFGYYLVDDKGEVLKKFGLPPKENTMDPDCCPISFSNASFVEGNTLFGVQRSSVNDEPEVSEYTFGSIDISSDSKTKKLLKLSAFVPDYKKIIEMELSKNPWVVSFHPSFYKLEEFLYAASPISDSVYVFKDFELVEKYYVGNEAVKPTDYRSFLLLSQIQQLKDGVQSVREVNQPPHYSDVFVSPDGNLIYRILIEATKGKKVETLDYEIPEVAKASLVVFDKSSGQLTTFDLPEEEIDIPLSTQSRSVFVSSVGIHFETKEQENEDRLDFRVFGLGKIE
ncbi:MAG: DUF4221 family protein, partial [Cytophagia bacterium]|nr:DUF4221 family protein [Cytophagia bacterium]